MLVFGKQRIIMLQSNPFHGQPFLKNTHFFYFLLTTPRPTEIYFIPIMTLKKKYSKVTNESILLTVSSPSFLSNLISVHCPAGFHSVEDFPFFEILCPLVLSPPFLAFFLPVCSVCSVASSFYIQPLNVKVLEHLSSCNASLSRKSHPGKYFSSHFQDRDSQIHTSSPQIHLQKSS